MANNINWGEGVDNNIGWGQGSTNNSIDWGSSYSVSYSGETLLEIASATPLTVDSTAYKADSTLIKADQTLI
jgi:hypothetical protein